MTWLSWGFCVCPIGCLCPPPAPVCHLSTSFIRKLFVLPTLSRVVCFTTLCQYTRNVGRTMTESKRLAPSDMRGDNEKKRRNTSSQESSPTEEVVFPSVVRPLLFCPSFTLG